MDEFEHRERGAENAFAHDEAQSFRIRIAALRKLGAWAAELGGPAAESLAASAFEGVDDETLIADLTRALQDAGVSEHRLRGRLATFMQEARSEIHGAAASGANQDTTRA